MVGYFTGIFTGMEKRNGQRGEYAIVRFLDDCGKIFECVARGSDVIETISCLEKLEKVVFRADVDTRDSYTKITFLGLE